MKRGRVLDLGCGGGQLLDVLGLKFDRVGMDISEAMLERARKLVPGATFVQGSATQPPPGPFDVVVAVGEVFGFAGGQEGREAVARAWQAIQGILEPGGVFLFDVPSPGRAPTPTHAAVRGNGWRVEAAAVEDGDTLVRTIDTWIGDEAPTREVHRLALMDQAWVLATLEDAGFRAEPLGAYDDHALQVGWDAYEAIA